MSEYLNDEAAEKAERMIITTGKFVVVVWYDPDASDAITCVDPSGGTRVFSTREEAEEFCNIELTGHYTVVELEN